MADSDSVPFAVGTDQVEIQKRLEAAVAASELTESIAGTGTWEIDTLAGLAQWSPETYRIHGRDRDSFEVTLESVIDAIHPDDRSAATAFIESVLRRELVRPLELRVVRPDGEVRVTEARARHVRPGCCVGTLQDITERRRTEQRLTTVEQLRQADVTRLRLAVEMAQFGAWELDVEQGTMIWSPEVYAILGQDRSTFELTPGSAESMVHPDDRARLTAFTRGLLADESRSPVEIRIIRDDGEVRWIRANGTVVGSTQLIGFVQDVTEEHLRDDQRRMHTQILEALNEGVFVLPLTPGVDNVYANPRFAHDMHCTVETALTMPATAFMGSGQDEQRAALREALIRDGRWEGDVQAHRTDGTEFVAHATVKMIDLADMGPACLIVETDVTHQRAQDAALRETAERLRGIQEHAPIGIGLAGLDGCWLEVNETMAAIVGLERAEIGHMPVIDTLHPDDRQRVLQDLDDLVEGRHRVAQREIRFVHRDGRIVWGLGTASILHDEHGDPQTMLLHLVDITDRKVADERMRAQALEIQRADQAKTEFLSRMSHELRTPLNAVLGYGQLLSLEDNGPDHGEAVEHILQAGRHLLDLIDEVLDITGVEAGTLVLAPEDLRLAPLVEDAIQLVQPMAAAQGITITTTPAADDADLERCVHCDRKRATQILLNLLSNAIKYNRADGRVTVTTEWTADHASIAVSDTGKGIAPDAIERVFDPFDRLGADQLGIQGTGIGLSLAKSLAERMNGSLAVSSQAGFGSTFTVCLPTAHHEPAPREGRPAAARPTPGPTAGTDLTVVNVEDNPANQQLVLAILRHRPHVRLLTASTADEGFSLIVEAQPDLVLLDLHLPDRAGTDILRQLNDRADGPNPVIAVLSAEANPEQIDTVLALGADHYFTKPIDINALLTLIDATARARAFSEPRTGHP